jgi:hypothetical protein
MAPASVQLHNFSWNRRLASYVKAGQHEKTIWALLGMPYLEDVPCIYSALAELTGMWSWENTCYKSSQTGAWKFCRLCDAIKHGCRCSCFQQRISWKFWMADKVTRFEETNRSHLDSGHPASGCGVLLCLLGIVTCLHYRLLKIQRCNAFLLLPKCCDMHPKSSYCKMQLWNWMIGEGTICGSGICTRR